MIGVASSDRDERGMPGRSIPEQTIAEVPTEEAGGPGDQPGRRLVLAMLQGQGPSAGPTGKPALVFPGKVEDGLAGDRWEKQAQYESAETDSLLARVPIDQ